jgi:hypothetical protein
MEFIYTQFSSVYVLFSLSGDFKHHEVKCREKSVSKSGDRWKKKNKRKEEKKKCSRREAKKSIKKCLLRFPYIDKSENNWILGKTVPKKKEKRAHFLGPFETGIKVFTATKQKKTKRNLFLLLLFAFTLKESPSLSFVQLIFLPFL